MQKGQPVPFILIDQTVNANKEVQYSFKIHPKAHEVFNSQAVKNKKVAIASVAGPQRSGKSFLSNRLLKRMTGFAIGPSTMPCTKGLWIWGEPIKISDDTVLIIMDTEGLNSVQRDVNVDLKIFSLSILLSSVFIYNSIGHIDEKALENMSYVLRISQNIKISSDNQSDNQMSKYFPYFYWVLRDFTLDLKGVSQNEYLQQSLKAVSNDEKDPRNQIRAKIRKLFTHRRCQCFPRPVLQENKLAHIEKLQYEDLRENFKTKMNTFERTFYSTLPPKTINNRAITGSIFLNLAYEYVNAMNNGKIPKIMNSLQSVIASEVRKVCDSYKSNFKNAMDQLMKPQKLPLEDSQIQKGYKHYLSLIQQKLNQKFKIWGDVKVVQAARTKLTQQLASDLQERLKQNSKLAEVSANRSILKLFQQIQLPQLKNSEMITTNLVTQKQQEFSKKYIQYLQSNKAPTKYTVFTKKFPTLIFDFFGRLVARIKGVYTDEINLLKNQDKANRSQINSIKRVSKVQQNYILELQRQRQQLKLQKEQLYREVKKLEELSAFQKQTQKMSKNQIKKTTDDLKRQLIEVSNEKEQLQGLYQKVKSQLANIKSKGQFSHTTSTQETSRGQRTEQPQNLPNQLVYLLVELKGKLSLMNQFYQKKAKDQTIDEYMNRQIQQYRNDKYQSLQKIKEQYQHKVDEQRYKTDKLIQTYEKQLTIINLHLDDIKNENIQLRKKLVENPGNQQKLKGFIMERKKFQESIRMKQNYLNSQVAINAQKQRQIEELKKQKDDISISLAKVCAQKANLDSFKGSFWYLLRQCINYATNKGNKLKHAMKSLDPDDQSMLLKTFNEVGLKY